MVLSTVTDSVYVPAAMSTVSLPAACSTAWPTVRQGVAALRQVLPESRARGRDETVRGRRRGGRGQADRGDEDGDGDGPRCAHDPSLRRDRQSFRCADPTDGAGHRPGEQNDLAELAAGGEAVVGGGDVGERERLGDGHAQRAALEQRQDLALDARGRWGPSPRAAGRAGSRRGASRACPSAPARLTSALKPRADADDDDAPGGGQRLRLSGRFGAPTSSRTTSNGPCSAKPSGSSTASAPSSATASRSVGVAHRRGHARAGRARRAGWRRCRRRRRRRGRAGARPAAGRPG